MAIAIPQLINQAAGKINLRLPYTSAAENRGLTLVEEETASNNPFIISNEVRLSQRDFERFLSRLFVDEEPNDELKKLAQDYKEKFG
jgi:uncharacterized protein (DUF1778 family)